MIVFYYMLKIKDLPFHRISHYRLKWQEVEEMRVASHLFFLTPIILLRESLKMS